MPKIIFAICMPSKKAGTGLKETHSGSFFENIIFGENVGPNLETGLKIVEEKLPRRVNSCLDKGV